MRIKLGFERMNAKMQEIQLKEVQEVQKLKEVQKVTRRTSFKIWETNDWDRFESLLGNREIDKMHVSNLITSFLRYPNLSRIVKTTEKTPHGSYLVIDGQHTLDACKYLDYKFPGKFMVLQIVEDSTTVEEIIALNTTTKNWGRAQYISSYAARGYEHYQKIYDLRNMYPEIKHLYVYCCALNKSCNFDKRVLIEQGKFVVDDWQKAVEICSWLMEIKAFLDKKDKHIWKKFKTLIALVRMFYHPHYDHNRFIGALKTQYIKFYPVSDRGDGLRICSDIFNYRISKQTSPVFFERLDTYKEK